MYLNLKKLSFFIVLLTSFFLGQVASATMIEELKNKTGNPIGGGKYYDEERTREYVSLVPSSSVRINLPIENQAAYKTIEEQLIYALDMASYGDTVFVRGDLSLDLSGRWNIKIPPGVTLASDRGTLGSLGALMFSKSFNPETNSFPALFRMEKGSRITGLRIQGPTPHRNRNGCTSYETVGIHIGKPKDSNAVVDNDAVVDNNEIFNWSHAAVSAHETNAGKIINNHIHHNQRSEQGNTDCGDRKNHGLGYGVLVNNASALIEANFFSHNRHDIAGTGKNNSGYQARYNVSERGQTEHSFDMHGCRDINDREICPEGSIKAGKDIIIEENTFLNSAEPRAISIRGKPEGVFKIQKNSFAQTERNAHHFDHRSPSPSAENFMGNEYSINLWRDYVSNETNVFGAVYADLHGDNIPVRVNRGFCGSRSNRCWRAQRWFFNKETRTTTIKAENWGNGAYFSSDSAKYGLQVGDFNDDGLDDIAYRGSCGSATNPCWRVQINHKGKLNHSNELPKNFGNSFRTNSSTLNIGVHSGDFNKDGKSDLIYSGTCDDNSSRTCLRVLITGSKNSSELKFTDYTFTHSAAYFSNETFSNEIGVGDFNNDGYADFGYYGKCGSGQKLWRYHLGSASVGNGGVMCSKEKLF